MQFQKTALQQAIARVQPAIPLKPTNPTLRGIKISTQIGTATLTGSDNDTTITARCDCDTTTEETIILPAKVLADIVGACPNKPITITHNEHTATITCGTSTYTIPTIGTDDYPTTPHIATIAGTINGQHLTEMINTTKAAVGTPGDAPENITGINMIAQHGQLTLQSTDRFKLVETTTPWDGNDFTALIPGKALTDAAKSVGILPVEIRAENGKFGWTAGGTTLITRASGADFPNIKNLFPKEHTTVATFDTAELIATIKRANIVANTKTPTITIHLAENSATITSASDQEESTHPVEAELLGEEITFHANPRYVTDILATINTTTVTLGATNPARPISVTGGHDIEQTPSGFTISHPTARAIFMPTRGA